MAPEVEVEKIKEEALIPPGEQGKRILSDKVMADCFIAMTLSMMEEFMMTSTRKYFIIQGMYSNLKRIGYSEVEMEKIENFMMKIAASYNQTNSFMG